MAKASRKTSSKKVGKKAPKKAARKATKASKVSKSPKKTAKAAPAKKSAKKTTKAAKKSTAASTVKKSAKKTAKSAKSPAKKTSKSAKKAAKKTTKKAAKTAKAPAKAPAKVAAKSAPSGLSFLMGKPGSTGDRSTELAEKPRLKKTKLGVADLRQFRQLLRDKRAQLQGDMSSMEKEALQSENSSLSHLPVHLADMGTDNYEQEFTLTLVDRDRKLVDEIDHALAKIDDKTYGICEGTGQMISKARLEAQPWARYSMEYIKSKQRPGVNR